MKNRRSGGRLARRRTAAALVVGLALLRCSGSMVHDSGSQTHWLDSCTADSDCRGGLTCECGLCTRPCSSADGCTDLGRPALCAPKGALSLSCAGNGATICLPACRGGCRPDEACVGDSCVPEGGAHDAGPGSASAGGESGATAGGGASAAGRASAGGKENGGAGAGGGSSGSAGAPGSGAAGMADSGTAGAAGSGGDAGPIGDGAPRDSGPQCGERPFTLQDGIGCFVNQECPADATCDSGCISSSCTCTPSGWGCTDDCRHVCMSHGGPILRKPESLAAAMTNYVWLVGWSGDLDHYSWIAFTPSPAGADHGTWATLAGQCGTCTSLFFCEGSDGSYTVEPAGMPGISRIDLSYPTACGATKKAETWIIGSFVRISGWLPNPEWTLPLEVTGGGPSLSATGYPRSRCNAAFTSCDPIF